MRVVNYRNAHRSQLKREEALNAFSQILGEEMARARADYRRWLWDFSNKTDFSSKQRPSDEELERLYPLNEDGIPAPSQAQDAE